MTKAKALKAARAKYGQAVDVYTTSEIVGHHSNPYARDAPRQVTAIVRRTAGAPVFVPDRTSRHATVQALSRHEAALKAWNDGIVVVATGATATEAWAGVLAELGRDSH